MLVPIIDGTKGRQDRCSRRAGGSRLASCLLLTAFRTRDHGKARSLGHRSGSGTILGTARASAYQMLTAARLPDFLHRGYRVREKTSSARNWAVCTSVASQPRSRSGGACQMPESALLRGSRLFCVTTVSIVCTIKAPVPVRAKDGLDRPYLHGR
jgi:hypothetical protein